MSQVSAHGRWLTTHEQVLAWDTTVYMSQSFVGDREELTLAQAVINLISDMYNLL